MPQPSHLSTDPFFFAGGPTGILLIHGFTGAPTEMRPMGEHLATRGLTALGVRLPGHGTTPQDLAQTGREDWIAACATGLEELRRRCATVFVGGLSLGALLALWLAAQHSDLAGLILLAPAIKVRDWRIHLTPLAKHFVRFLPTDHTSNNDLVDPDALGRDWCYDATPVAAAAEVLALQHQARWLLPRVTQPALIMQGRHDGSLAADAAQITHDLIGSADKTLIWLENSGHNVLIDAERTRVWEESYAWMRARCQNSA
jgi:carboxylesterase